MRALNRAKHHIDAVAPGEEGDFPDNRATRAMIDQGLLKPVERLPPEPPAKAPKPVDPDMPSRDQARDLVEEVERRGDTIARLQREAEHLNATLTVDCGACTPDTAAACVHCNGARLVPAVAEVDRLRARVAELETIIGGPAPAQPPVPEKPARTRRDG